MAAAIILSPKTVKARLSSVYRKLRLSFRTQLVRCPTEADVAPP
ncbi:LuxR C-terminal-related transcriptional regulator [Streptomyces sp. AS02]|nr:LuxR C-terminal-related transcriptional regulator [Streptomyces sp. AS02]